MAQIWDMDIRPQGKKLVLLAFADAANEDGLTWMAIESQRGKRSIMTKASASKRAVQAHIALLEAEGHLERNETIGKGCLWRVHPTPAKFAGVKGRTPANSAPPPANFAPEPSSNHHLEEETRERLSPSVDKCPLTSRVLVTGLSLPQWEAFLDMRVSLAKPVKPYVANVLLEKLDGIAKAGWHPGDVVDRSTVNAWPDVYEPETGRVTGVRRVVGSDVGEPVGMSPEDRAELARIAQIDNVGEMLEARRAFMASVERRNAAEPISALIGQLPLRPPLRGEKR